VTVSLRCDDGVATFRFGDALFTRYHHGPALARPHFDPLLAPGGTPVTRGPDEVGTLDGRPDHPHHRGVWVGHRDVGGVDTWTEHPGHGRIAHRDFEHIATATLRERLAWTDADDRPLLDETRTIRVAEEERRRVLDLDVRLVAGHGAVTLGDAKDAATVAVRVAPPLQGDRGGRIATADGRRGEAAAWGAAARWCHYAGEGGGVAVLDHPGNPRHPTRWHVRAYGLLCANPFGSRCFDGPRAPDGAMTLRAGAAVAFRHRLLVHAGDLPDTEIEAAWSAFAAEPAAA